MFRRNLTDCEIQQIQAYNRIADEMNRANELKEEELEVRDRVDISLKEYMNLVNERENLRAKVNNYESIFEGFNLPADVKILPGSIEFDHMDNICDLIRTYCLRFDVNLHEVRRLGL